MVIKTDNLCIDKIVEFLQDHTVLVRAKSNGHALFFLIFGGRRQERVYSRDGYARNWESVKNRELVSRIRRWVRQMVYKAGYSRSTK